MLSLFSCIERKIIWIQKTRIVLCLNTGCTRDFISKHYNKLLSFEYHLNILPTLWVHFKTLILQGIVQQDTYVHRKVLKINGLLAMLHLLATKTTKTRNTAYLFTDMEDAVLRIKMVTNPRESYSFLRLDLKSLI